MFIPVQNKNDFGAVRTDVVNVSSLGEYGISPINFKFFIESGTKQGDTIISNINPGTVQTKNYLTVNDVLALIPWNRIIHSPVIAYNHNIERELILAEDYRVLDDGQRIEVDLVDGATFHDGSPITSEDVKFTFDHLFSHPETYPNYSNVPPFDSIETPDDKTTVFKFTEPYLPFLTVSLSRWGILSKDAFEDAGAIEDPEGAQFDEIVGSGPFQVNGFESGQEISLEPFDDHPVWSPDHNLVFINYDSEQTALQAFKSNEIQVLNQISTSTFEELQDADYAQTTTYGGFYYYGLYPQFPVAPTKSTAFRRALGTAMNRQKVNDIVFRGIGTNPKHAGLFLDSHPWYPDDDNMIYKYTEKDQGDIEAARQTLADAGFGWDDNDDLHYPADMNLGDYWPRGETPRAEEFPCIEDY